MHYEKFQPGSRWNADRNRVVTLLMAKDPRLGGQQALQAANRIMREGIVINGVGRPGDGPTPAPKKKYGWRPRTSARG